MSYQVTMNIADTREEAQAGIDAYISQYYPELSKAMDLGEWGPVGTPDDIADWFADLRRRRRRLLHLPLRLARSVRTGRAVGARRPAGASRRRR